MQYANEQLFNTKLEKVNRYYERKKTKSDNWDYITRNFVDLHAEKSLVSIQFNESDQDVQI